MVYGHVKRNVEGLADSWIKKVKESVLVPGLKNKRFEELLGEVRWKDLRELIKTL